MIQRFAILFFLICLAKSKMAVANYPTRYCEEKFTYLLSSGRIIEDTALQGQTNYFLAAKKLKEIAMDSTISKYERRKTIEQLLTDMQDWNEFRCLCPKYCKTVYIPLSQRGLSPAWWTLTKKKLNR